MKIGTWVTAMLAALAASFVPAGAASAAGAGCNPRQPVVCDQQGRVVQLVGAGDDTCALTERGQVYCWAAGEGDRAVSDISLLLITIGSLLVAGGASLVLISRP